MSKSNLVGIKDLRNNLEKYIKEIERGKSFMVLRRSRPVFRIEPVDESGVWETVVDFTKVDAKGVPAERVLKALRALKKR